MPNAYNSGVPQPVNSDHLWNKNNVNVLNSKFDFGTESDFTPASGVNNRLQNQKQRVQHASDEGGAARPAYNVLCV